MRIASEADRRKWIREAPDVVQAVRRAASLAGVELLDFQARAIADAARTYADGILSVSHAAVRERWEIEGFRDHVRRDLRIRLLDEVTSGGLIPVDLPAEGLRYLRMSFGSADAGQEVPESADWDTVVVSLTVPVRKPPVDRAAAVKAGILTGSR